MKKILIPTDFTTSSLQLIEYAILNYPEEALEIVLVHGYKVSEQRNTLRNFSSSKVVYQMADAFFENEIDNFLVEHKDSIAGIRYELYTGSTVADFKKFLEQQQIAAAILPNSCFLSLPSSKSFSMHSLIKQYVGHICEINLGNKEDTFLQRNSFTSRDVNANNH